MRTIFNNTLLKKLNEGTQKDILMGLVDNKDIWNDYYIEIEASTSEDINMPLEKIINFYIDMNFRNDDIVNELWELAFNNKKYENWIREDVRLENWLNN